MRSEGKGVWVGFGVVERSFGTPQSRSFCAGVLSVRRGSRRFRKKDEWIISERVKTVRNIARLRKQAPGGAAIAELAILRLTCGLLARSVQCPRKVPA